MIARRVELLGVPFNSSGTTNGVARAPTALRDAGLVEALRATGLKVIDRGDLSLGPTDSNRDPTSRLIAPVALTTMIRTVRRAVRAILETEGFPLVLGGDCPVLLGCLGAGRLGAPPGLLFVDGHEDAWPPRWSKSGEAADMELGLALGLTVGGLPEALIAEIPHLDARRVLVVGPRDQGELAEAGVPSIEGVVEIIRGEALAKTDAEMVGADASARLGRLGPWWLHVDLDVLATESLGAVDYRQPGGIDWDALTRLSRSALKNGTVLGWDVTIYNPDLDETGTDARAIVRYLADALGG